MWPPNSYRTCTCALLSTCVPMYDSQTRTCRVCEMYDSRIEAHLAWMTRKSHARSNIQFSYGWWATHKLVARATCSISTTHYQPPRKHYVLYVWATANKSTELVRAKTRTAGRKASFRCTPLRNMPRTFDVNSQLIFSHPPTHLYILRVDVY